MRELFPIGTVVLLTGATKRVMITGYMVTEVDKPDKVYDYSGVMYPEGSLSSDQVLLFNHSQIRRVYCEGYKDNEFDTFMVKLNRVIESTNGEGGSDAFSDISL